MAVKGLSRHNTQIMFIKSLQLANFRNFSSFEKEFSQRNVLVLGKNGSGKTSLLEAISFLSLGSSFRARKDQEVIKWGENLSLIQGVVNGSVGVSHQLAVALKPEQKILTLDNKPKLLLEFIGHLLTISFSPWDLTLLQGTPSRRRRFLDQTVSFLDLGSLSDLLEFKKILQNRNQLLRKRDLELKELDFWNQRFVKNASLIFAKRVEVLALLNQFLSEKGLGQPIYLRYLPSPQSFSQFASGTTSLINLEGAFREKLENLFTQERRLGFSLIGPQRDEVRLLQKRAGKEIDLGVFGSRGEQRLAIIHLKKAQFELLAQKKGEVPILLLDDVFSELDEKNRKEVLKILSGAQALITSTEKLPIFSQLENCQVIKLS